MIVHGRIGPVRVFRAEGVEQPVVFLQRLLGDAAVEHQAEDVQVDVLVVQRLPHEFVVRDPQDLVVEMGIRPGKAGIPAVPVDGLFALLHVGAEQRASASAFSFRQACRALSGSSMSRNL